MNADIIRFYSEPGAMSRGVLSAQALADAPSDLPALRAWIQGMLVHEHLTWLYGFEAAPERRAHSQRRFIDDVLAGIRASSDVPLDVAREPADRSIGVCSHFTLLAVSVLRAHGIAARARCGFGMYFEPSKGVDHWIVETWTGARWQRADFQVDGPQREQFGIALDTLDLAEGMFLTGAEAWRLARAGQADPQQFGLFDEGGLWFIASNMIRDLASLNKVEMLPWDDWGAMPSPDVPLSEAALERFDRLAELAFAPDRNFHALQATYLGDEFHMSGEVFNASRRVRERVAVPAAATP